MEKIQTIDEYIASAMEGKIVRKRKSPVVGLFVLAVGLGLLVAVRKAALADSLQMLTLTVGVFALAIGVLLTAMNLGGAMTYYRYQPTHSRMKEKKVYLNADDYQRVLSAFGDNAEAVSALREVSRQVTSYKALRVLRSADGAVALVQAWSLEPGQYKPESPTLCLTGTDVDVVETLCR